MENISLPTNNCSLYNNRDFVVVAIVNAAVAFISFLACTLAIFIIILFKKWQFFSQRLILYLIISSMLVSIATILHRVDYNEQDSTASGGFCAFSAFAGQVTAWYSLMAISAITVYLFIGAVWNKSTEKQEPLYIFFIFAFPLTFNWIPFIRQSYGRAGVWCWIRTLDYRDCSFFRFGQALQLVLYYIPLFTVLAILVTLYLIILCKLQINKRHWKGTVEQETNQKDKMRSETLFLLAYPIIYIILSVPLILNRIQSWVVPTTPSFVLWYLSGICHPLIGLIFTLAFTLHADTRHRLRWSHIRAAFRNYNSSKGVSEYVTGAVEDQVEFDSVSYKAITDKTSLEEIEKT